MGIFITSVLSGICVHVSCGLVKEYIRSIESGSKGEPSLTFSREQNRGASTRDPLVICGIGGKTSYPYFYSADYTGLGAFYVIGKRILRVFGH